MYRKALALALIAALLACCGAWAEEAGPESYLGGPMPDFTVTTYDGETVTLSETLTEKKAVLVNLWASWCGPCEEEFPYIEHAYEEFADDVEVIALSVEPEDTDETLAAYAESHGMTFKVANDAGTGIGDIFAPESIPTSVLVDRFGNVTLIEVGAQSSADPFMGAFELLTSDDYTETQVLDGFPRAKPDIQGAREGELAAALGLPFYVASSDDEYAWPFEAGELDGVPCVHAGNAGRDSSEAVLLAHIEAQAGDAFSFRARISSELSYDKAQVYVNGEIVKTFTGIADWVDYAVALDEGSNDVEFHYVKDEMASDGDDTFYLADFRLLSGDEAGAALDAVPKYPYAEDTSLELITEGAREIVFAPGEEGTYADYFLEGARFYILNGDAAEFSATFSAECDPDDVYIYGAWGEDEVLWTAWDALEGPLTASVDSLETTGYNCSWIYTFSGNDIFDMIVYMRDEENANALEAELMGEGLTSGYAYVDGGERATLEIAVLPDDMYDWEDEEDYDDTVWETEEDAAEDAAEETAEALDGEATWTVSFVDQYGEAVPGCVINFCTDDACTPTFADENGVAVFTGAPFAYHLQIIRVPEGYAFDTTQEFYAEEHGGDMEFIIEKE